MKNILLLFLTYCLTGCHGQKLTYQEVVTNYYSARDAVNYDEIKKYMDENITITEGDFVMPYDHDSFYEVFKWDSIFQPSYNIIELEEKNNRIIASIVVSSIRNEFLKNSPMTCRYNISFNSDKISKIESLECADADWNIWQKERDSLVSWINKNHPELDGFIHDMTMKGAINYLKAIELYNAERKSHNK